MHSICTVLGVPLRAAALRQRLDQGLRRRSIQRRSRYFDPRPSRPDASLVGMLRRAIDRRPWMVSREGRMQVGSDLFAAAHAPHAATPPRRRAGVMTSRRFRWSNCIRLLPANVGSHHIELAAISQRGGLLGVRSTSISGNNRASQAFPGGAKSGCEHVQQNVCAELTRSPRRRGRVA